MPLKTRRWCSPQEPDDGLRVLVCRFRPRALPKAQETWDVWLRELGPSPELLKAFQGKTGVTLSLAAYRARYEAEMAEPAPRQRIRELAGRVARGETVTLLCSKDCIVEQACHRTLLRGLILGAVAEKQLGEEPV